MNNELRIAMKNFGKLNAVCVKEEL